MTSAGHTRARAASHEHRSEVRDGMRIDWDVPIEVDDGLVLRADIFRPVKDGRYPVILSYGPYAKGLAFQDGYPSAWQRMADAHPDVTAGSSNLYQSWEVVDPEKWVPHDYACVRVDSRGCGCSPGFIDHFSPRETKDFYDCKSVGTFQRLLTTARLAVDPERIRIVVQLRYAVLSRLGCVPALANAIASIKRSGRARDDNSRQSHRDLGRHGRVLLVSNSR